MKEITNLNIKIQILTFFRFKNFNLMIKQVNKLLKRLDKLENHQNGLKHLVILLLHLQKVIL